MAPALAAALALLGRLLGGAVAGAIRKRQDQHDEAEELLVRLLVDSDDKEVRAEVGEALLSLMREHKGRKPKDNQ